MIATANPEHPVYYEQTLVESPVSDVSSFGEGLLSDFRVPASYSARGDSLDDTLLLDVLREIVNLRHDPDEDSPPTEFALEEVARLIPLSRIRLGQNWIRPRVATDGYNGLRLSWRDGRRELRAIISGDPAREHFLYRQENDQYDAVPKFTAVTLYTFLDLFRNGRPLF
jgi:hypothetical protein